MRWEEAKERVAARSAAATGSPADGPDVVQHVGRPQDMARRLLSGVLEGEELEAALGGLLAVTNNAIGVLAATPDYRGGVASLYVLFTQNLLMGLLVGSSPERVRGDGASQEPSDDFDGATE
jgi:hypothetical protein